MKITAIEKNNLKFILVFSLYLLLIAILSARIHHMVLAEIALVAIVMVLFLGVTIPKFVNSLKIISYKLLHILSWVNTRLIFAIIYFTIFTFIAFFRRVSKKNRLYSVDKNTMTYRILSREANNDLRKPY